MKIGIFGGTFDPWHLGHSAIVKKALEKVDKVIIVPTTVNYYREDKRYLFTFDEKCEIIEEFLTGIDGAVEIDTIEKNKDVSWRTVHLLEYFKEKFPNDELYYIIGEDSYKNFKTWFRYEDILRLAKLLVANRGYDVVDPEVPFEPLMLGSEFVESSASKVRQMLMEELRDMYMSDKEWYNRLM